ncbi:MAG: hypothetical protein KDD41_08855 [Flavobacteriales bacterium]|nr:hypothetical protein [Flavobacteriales bacterium]
MRIKPLFLILIFTFSLSASGQDEKSISYKKLSCPEKWWVFWHPFVAKKAQRISQEARIRTDSIKKNHVLKGSGNGDQVDAFRHAYWMAALSQEIGWNKAKSLGRAHEKGNYRDYKKRWNEEGALPDKIGSTMDLFNNIMGLAIGMTNEKAELEQAVIDAVQRGNCKVIKTDAQGNFLDAEGNIIPEEAWKGKWENSKVLVWSNEVSE